MGGERIDKDLNIEQIIRLLRDVDFVMKEKFLD